MSKPYGLTIFCDDIRAEVGGKFTYVGVYGSDLQIVGTPPIILPMLSCVVQILIPFGFKYEKLKLAVKMIAGKTETVIAEISGPPPRPAPSKDKAVKQILNLTLSPFRVEGNGRLLVRAYFDELEIKLGALDIKVAQPPLPADST